MSRVFYSVLVSDAAFALGWFGNGWSRTAPGPAPAPGKTENAAAQAPSATTASRMEQFLQTRDASARMRLLAGWKSLTLSEIKSLWEERERVPKLWRHAV